MKHTQIFSFFLVLSLTLSGAAAFAQPPQPEGKPLIFGLLPSESAVAKFKRYAPLRDYLSERLGKPIRLETARDFPEFIKRTQSRQYDFLETAPHFVPGAIDSGHYQVLTTIVQPLTAQIVVHKDSPYRRCDELAGHIVATPSPKAIITKIGRSTLDAWGLVGEQQPNYRTFKTHNAAYEAVLNQQAVAAIISVNIYNKARKNNKPLISIGESAKIPNMSIIAANDLPTELIQKLQKQLVAMKNETEGQKVLEKIAYPGYRIAAQAEFDKLRPYLK